MNEVIAWVSLALLVLAAVLLLVLVLRRPADPSAALAEIARQQQAQLAAGRELREEMASQARENRLELSGALGELARNLTQQMGTIATVQNAQIDGFAQQLAKLTEANEQRLAALRESVANDAQRNREEIAATLRAFADVLQRGLADLTEKNEARLAEVRAVLETKIRELQSDNAAKLEEMRRTVDEKLHATLEQRLGESFKLVSERLEQVHRGLGEMQSLAAGVGDLKRVLTNVKTRGVWGEVQLASLLEQVLTPEQYERNVATVPGSSERVEYAIRLPGREGEGREGAPVRLPIDAKFPREDYERLLDAQERADPAAAEEAARALEMRIRAEAKTIRDKYIEPPHTTDFALLFLPTEGLYAEVLRRPGLADDVQRLYRVTIAGPTTLAALLNSLQMGFRTLAVERRSSEVWQLLGAVKTEFGKFGDVLAKTKEQIDRASNTLGTYQTRTRAIERKLRGVEALPEADARGLLGEALGAEGADAAAEEGEGTANAG